MKIMFASGGSGGHFYPIVAVARSLQRIAEEKKIVSLDMVLVADKVFEKHLFEFEGVRSYIVKTGKLRRYFSLRTIGDSVTTLKAIFHALWFVYAEMPDVIFSKGGYASFPVLFAARFFNIPVMIHESDTVPGKVNAWAASFARRIAISFPETAEFFPKEKTAVTGNPIRTQIVGGNPEEAYALLKLQPNVPVLFVLGGSQGAEVINNAILQIVVQLTETIQVVHQCGQANFETVTGQASVVLGTSPHKARYHAFPFLDEGQLRNASHLSNLIVSRAGGGAIFEIAAWGVPSILIPLPLAAQDHQRKNAYAYARAGACEVIEESNLTPSVLLAQIRRLLEDTQKRDEMRKAAGTFSRMDAADTIARELIQLALHETE